MRDTQGAYASVFPFLTVDDFAGAALEQELNLAGPFIGLCHIGLVGTSGRNQYYGPGVQT